MKREITWGNVISICWALFWRQLLISTAAAGLVGLLFGVVMGGMNAPSETIALVCFLSGLIISPIGYLIAMKMILGKNFGTFNLVLIPNEFGSNKPSEDEPSREPRGNAAGVVIIVIFVCIIGFCVWEEPSGPNRDQTISRHTRDDGYTQSVSGSRPAANSEQTVNYQIVGAGKIDRATAPNSRFTDHGDGTVTDNQTGLEWLQAPHSHYGNSKSMNWDSAKHFCDDLVYAGHSDWRLPSKDELERLSKAAAAKYSAQFEGFPFADDVGGCYWSASDTDAESGFAWYVYIGDARVGTYYKTYDNYVLPVRGGR